MNEYLMEFLLQMEKELSDEEIIYMQHMKTYNQMKVYQSMLAKALTGDVNSAKYLDDFNSRLDKMAMDNKQEQSEIDELLKGVQINSGD